MPSVTYDGLSFMVDGRRVWLVGGTIAYSRVPHQLWADRIHAAKLAGLNTIDTPVFWNRHEPRPGQFDFTGDNDLRRFVKLIGEAGMYCILRPGPYVGAEWDLGGLPAWLLDAGATPLRASSGPYLEACSRYLSAVSERVRDLQVTASGKGGPIILVQNEAEWMCGDDKAALYLHELSRYLREAGLNVPIVNSNNLWHGVEGEIDCWSGGGDLLATVRQLAAVRPSQPRIIIDFEISPPTAWGDPAPDPMPPSVLQRRLAEIVAAGGQFNISAFHAGVGFGFWPGRSPEARDAFLTPGRGGDSPLSESGRLGPTFHAVRRICTFASRFARLLSNLEPEYRPIVKAPGVVDPASKGEPGPIVLHAQGGNGSVAFLFSEENAGETAADGSPRSITLLLPDGETLPVPLGGESVVWCLCDALIGGRARLDYCNLSAMGVVGQVLVCFGPEGAEGRMSVNGSPVTIVVPDAKAPGPAIVEHEGVTLVVANPTQADSIYLTDDGVFIGVSWVTPAGRPVPPEGAVSTTRISPDGTHSVFRQASPTPARKPIKAPAFGEWSMAPTADYTDGSSARYAAIDGPAELSKLGSPYGLGWYRIRLKAPRTGRFRVAMPHAADRCQVFIEGDSAGLVGVGPGAKPEITLPLKQSPQTMVVLCENLGRYYGGSDLEERKGLYGHLWQVAPIRPAKPVVKTGEPIDLLKFRTPLWGVHEGDLSSPDRLTWSIPHRKKGPLLIVIDEFVGRCLLLVNDKPVKFLDRGGATRIFIDADQLGRGSTSVQISLLEEASGPDHRLPDIHELAPRLAAGVSFFAGEANLTEDAEWAFAKWETPRGPAFKPAKAPASARGAGPTWWRSTFATPNSPTASPPNATAEPAVWIDLTGMTKGQLYVNGHHVCRYFVATADGKPVPPQSQYHVPSTMLAAEGPSEITLFDEHGGSPSKCRIVLEQ